MPEREGQVPILVQIAQIKLQVEAVSKGQDLIITFDRQQIESTVSQKAAWI